MNEVEVIEIGREAIMAILYAAGPLMLVALGVGLAVSLFQALTQIQEMTLAFVPKILAIFGASIMLAPFMISILDGLARDMFDRIVAVGGS
ncbi:MAG: flagellar biosynthesis protein FliQ [Alphaproteobacteria bacterium]